MEALDPNVDANADLDESELPVWRWFDSWCWWRCTSFTQETRSDQVRFHTAWARAGAHTLSYEAMAVTRGKFVMPPAKASPSLEPEVLGLSKGGEFNVLPSGSSPEVVPVEPPPDAPINCPKECSLRGTKECSTEGVCECNDGFGGPDGTCEVALSEPVITDIEPSVDDETCVKYKAEGRSVALSVDAWTDGDSENVDLKVSIVDETVCVTAMAKGGATRRSLSAENGMAVMLALRNTKDTSQFYSFKEVSVQVKTVASHTCEELSVAWEEAGCCSATLEDQDTQLTRPDPDSTGNNEDMTCSQVKKAHKDHDDMCCEAKRKRRALLFGQTPTVACPTPPCE